jgi:hypothetical protein
MDGTSYQSIVCGEHKLTPVPFQSHPPVELVAPVLDGWCSDAPDRWNV